MTAAKAGAAVTSDGVYLVDENDAGGVALGLVEEVTHPGSADANEHLDELAAADGEEGDGGFTCDGPGQQGLAGAGRAYQENAPGDAGSKGEEPFRVLEELHHFLELGLRLVGAGHVGEADGGAAGEDHLGLAAAKVHGLVAASLGLTHEENYQRAEENEG